MWRGLGWDSGAMLRYCHVKTGLRYSMVFFQSNSEDVDRWLLKLDKWLRAKVFETWSACKEKASLIL